MTPSDAEKELAKIGLKGQTGDSVFSDDVENGEVATQDPKAGSTAKAGDTTGITIRYCEMSEGAYSYIETNDPERVAQALAAVNEVTLGQGTDVMVLDWDQWVVFERGDEALGSVSFNGGYLSIEGINYEDNQGASGLWEAFDGLEMQYEE